MNIPALKIAAIGDIALVGRYETGSSADVFAEVKPIFRQHDLVIGNLESPIIRSGTPVPGKCTLKTDESWGPGLHDAGIDVLSLANNHVMDYGPAGLLATIECLEKAGIRWLGAGRDILEANAPLFLQKKGHRVALLARTSVFVSSPSYAGVGVPGVARFDQEETIETLKVCRNEADSVVLLLHWGLENYRYPAPSQRMLARQLIESGADLILGHHPHVLQGIEYIEGRPVAHSLGNFLFDDIPWSFIDGDGNSQDQVMALSESNREAGILTIHRTRDEAQRHEFVATRIAVDGSIVRDDARRGARDFQRLSRRLNLFPYTAFWRLYALRMEWRLRILPLLEGKLSVGRILSIRPKHLRSLFRTLRRSVGITTENRQSPYE